MKHCDCARRHGLHRVVLTGGPGAGKTALLELLRQVSCPHVRWMPEAAGILFSGGFPRGSAVVHREAVQRAIYHVQRQLETIGDAENAAVVVCDRGTVDGAAYWPGGAARTLWDSVGSSLKEELARYDAVIHLRTPPVGSGFYNRSNPLRLETEEEAAAIDRRIARLWSSHPRRFEVEASTSFLDKVARAVEILSREVPVCCRAGLTQRDHEVTPGTAATDLVLTSAADEEC